MLALFMPNNYQAIAIDMVVLTGHRNISDEFNR